MKKKVVFYVRDLTLGAINKVLQNLVNALDKTIFDITIISVEKRFDKVIINNFSKDIKIKYILNDSLTFLRNKHLKNKFEKNNFISSMIVETIKLFFNIKSVFELKKEKYDVFIDFESMYLYRYLSLFKIKNKVAVIHENRYRTINSKKRKIKIKKQMEKYNKIIFLTKEQTKDFTRLFPELNKKFYNIYNSFNIEKIKELSKETFSPKDKKWVNNKKYSLMLSRLSSGKDFEIIFKALLEIKKRELLNFNFYFLGDGKEKYNLEYRVKELNLEKNVFFLGKKDNPYNWIKNSEFIIMTSHFEGLNNVIIESLILEKIIIANKFKYGAEEVLSNGKYGFLIENHNYLELAKTIEKILKENKKVSEYFPNISKSYTKFSSEKIAKKWEEIFKI